MTGRTKTRRGHFTAVWEFRVSARRRRAFEKAYGSEGAWAQLFRTGEGYMRTELLRDRKAPGRYLTIDYWNYRHAFLAFKKRKRAEYEALDKKCAALTQGEKLLGEFESWEQN